MPATLKKNSGGGSGFLLLLLLIAGATYLSAMVPQKSYPLRNISSFLKYQVLRTFGENPKLPSNVADTLIDQAADRHGIDRALFRALVHVESGKNSNAVSHAGAIGMSQIMPANTKRCGLRSHLDLKDAVWNLNCGALILSQEIKAHRGNLNNALAVYNCGKAQCPPGQQYAKLVLSIANRRMRS